MLLLGWKSSLKLMVECTLPVVVASGESPFNAAPNSPDEALNAAGMVILQGYP